MATYPGEITQYDRLYRWRMKETGELGHHGPMWGRVRQSVGRRIKRGAALKQWMPTRGTPAKGRLGLSRPSPPSRSEVCEEAEGLRTLRGEWGSLEEQEFRLEGQPPATSELIQSSNRRQAAVRVSHTYGQVRGNLPRQKLSEAIELLPEPGNRFLTRTHALRTAIGLRGGDSANPT